MAGVENCAVIRPNGYFSDRDCQAQQNFICKKAQDYSELFNTWSTDGFFYLN